MFNYISCSQFFLKEMNHFEILRFAATWRMHFHVLNFAPITFSKWPGAAIPSAKYYGAKFQISFGINTHASSKSVVKQSYDNDTTLLDIFCGNWWLADWKYQIPQYILEVSHFVTFNVLVQRILDYHNDSVQKYLTLIKYYVNRGLSNTMTVPWLT